MDPKDTKVPEGQPKKKARGRPRKSELPSQQKRPVGRPKGTQAIINDYRDRMLASPKSRKVLETILNAALDDEHKNQAAAWKLVIDRIAPLSAFENEISKGGGRNAIQINITGVPNVDVGSSNEPVDADFEAID